MEKELWIHRRLRTSDGAHERKGSWSISLAGIPTKTPAGGRCARIRPLIVPRGPVDSRRAAPPAGGLHPAAALRTLFSYTCWVHGAEQWEKVGDALFTVTWRHLLSVTADPLPYVTLGYHWKGRQNTPRFLNLQGILGPLPNLYLKTILRGLTDSIILVWGE